MVVEMVPLKGGIGSIWGPPEGKDYKWYISGIYCQLGNQKQPLILYIPGGAGFLNHQQLT